MHGLIIFLDGWVDWYMDGLLEWMDAWIYVWMYARTDACIENSLRCLNGFVGWLDRLKAA